MKGPKTLPWWVMGAEADRVILIPSFCDLEAKKVRSQNNKLPRIQLAEFWDKNSLWETLYHETLPPDNRITNSLSISTIGKNILVLDWTNLIGCSNWALCHVSTPQNQIRWISSRMKNYWCHQSGWNRLKHCIMLKKINAFWWDADPDINAQKSINIMGEREFVD